MYTLLSGSCASWKTMIIGNVINLIIVHFRDQRLIFGVRKTEELRHHSKAVTKRCSVKKVFLYITKNSSESTCARVSFFYKVAGLRSATLLKKRLWHSCFPVKCAKLLRTSFLTEHLRWLLLTIQLQLPRGFVGDRLIFMSHLQSQK